VGFGRSRRDGRSLELPGWRARQGIDQDELARRLEASETLPAVFAERVEGRRERSIRGNDPSDDPLTPFVIGDAGDGNVGHARMRAERGFDLIGPHGLRA